MSNPDVTDSGLTDKTRTNAESRESAVAILPGDDVHVAKEFYAGGLGFNVSFEWSEDGKNGLVGFERNGMRFTIDCPMSGHGRNACLSLEVKDADAYYEEWRARVSVSREPKDEYWGKRTFGLEDPFGNSIFVMGPLSNSHN